MKYIVVDAVIFASLIWTVMGHGAMVSPLSRNAIDRSLPWEERTPPEPCTCANSTAGSAGPQSKVIGHSKYLVSCIANNEYFLRMVVTMPKHVTGTVKDVPLVVQPAILSMAANKLTFVDLANKQRLMTPAFEPLTEMLQLGLSMTSTNITLGEPQDLPLW